MSDIIKMMTERSSGTTWEGTLASGRGTVRATSGAWESLPSPVLAAAAHSACFAMDLALRLGEHQVTADRLSITAILTLDDLDSVPTIVSSVLRVRGRVPGVDQAAFRTAVDEAAGLCPVSRLFAGAKVSVESEFEPA